MAFVKLDCGILNSTLWIEKDARDIFITALLMAEPKEFTERVVQLFPNSCDDMDYSVPPGWYGYVPASAPGISHRAMVDFETKGKQALERLARPEPESRSSEFEGRRMIRINGGF